MSLNLLTLMICHNMAARALSSVTRAALISSKTVYQSSKHISCCRTMASYTNISSSPLSRSKTVYRQNTCGSGPAWFEHVCGIHTKGDKELIEFITEEIKAELKIRKHPEPPKVEGFEIQTDDAEVKMTRKFNNENITVTVNVNHSMDEETSDDIGSPEERDDQQTMKSKPDFTVEIEKGGKTLAFTCSFSTDVVPDEQSQDSYNDAFQITELSMYDKEWEDETYSVSGEIMDGMLYDLLMNMLEERGITNEFADKLVEYCTAYEHGLYIGLLKELKEFISAK